MPLSSINFSPREILSETSPSQVE
ncbi:Bgt-51841 [Blumeria graminis f. sp. tritici]|uniref:Bgt-51841 n=1 Tax=Blumeria graminis f. sp. tritici TaxID=62690 RepID=A0A9X9QG12_BLUGR|nr:Bgt-51841 [Blumeria graminis f. sp. tritici]